MVNSLEKNIFEFMHSSNDLVLIFNSSKEVIYGNNMVFKALGTTREEYTQFGVGAFIHPDDKVKLTNKVNIILRNPGVYFTEKLRSLTKEGLVVGIEWKSVYNKDTQQIFALGRVINTESSSDIQILEAKKLAKIGVWEYNVEQNSLKWDEEVYRIYELSSSMEMTLDRMKQFFRKESLEIFEAHIKSLLSSGLPFDEELNFISGQFKPSTARFIAKLINKEDKKIIGTIQDLTDIRRIERKAEDYREAVDKSSIVSITDRYGVITEVNDKFCQITKYNKQELIGKTHKILNSKYHPPEFWSHMWEKISIGEVWHGEIKNRAKDGSFIWIDTTIIPFKNSIGRIYQYLAIQKDFTENKKLGEELMVSEKLSSIGEISAQILHEVMTPLSIISLSIENLEDEIGELTLEDQKLMPIKTNLTEIKLNYEKIEEIFDNMRSILVRKNKGESTDINIKKTITKSLSLVNAKMKSRNIVVNYDSIDEMATIHTTETDLSQIFLNLFNNAADAIEKLENKWIEIKSYCSEGNIYIRFQDSGEGIPEDIRANMFDTLFTTKGENRGTGLGMGVVKKLIERHHGKISIDIDAPNTTFVLKFPIINKNRPQ